MPNFSSIFPSKCTLKGEPNTSPHHHLCIYVFEDLVILLISALKHTRSHTVMETSPYKATVGQKKLQTFRSGIKQMHVFCMRTYA